MRGRVRPRTIGGMTQSPADHAATSTRLLAVAAPLVPVCYFGAQIVGGLAAKDYSFVRDTASRLGARGAEHPRILNGGALLTGVAGLATGLTLPDAAHRAGMPRWLGWLIGVSVISVALGALSAGLFPLPDWRHGGGPVGAGAFVLPLILALALRSAEPAWLRWYGWANLAVFAAGALLMSGATGIAVSPNEGLFQRLLAAAVFIPIGVVGTALARRHPTA